MLYSYKGNEPQPAPERIRFANGATKTDSSTFTDDLLRYAGYIKVDPKPIVTDAQEVYWSYNEIKWIVVDKTPEQIAYDNNQKIEQQWETIRKQRDRLMSEFEWRYNRHARQLRLGITPTDSIEEMDAYMQALANITDQQDPFNIIWPEY